jgi:hypothetical protein
LIGIRGGLGAGKHGVVAGALGLDLEPAPGDPGQRVEPVDGADAPRKAVDEPVAPGDVLELVGDGASEIGGGPVRRVGRQEDRGAEGAAGDRAAETFVEQQIDAVFAAPREGRPAQAADLPQPRGDGEKKQRRARAPGSHEQIAKRPSR